MKAEIVIGNRNSLALGAIYFEKNREVVADGIYRQLTAVQNGVFASGGKGNGLGKWSLQLLRIFGV